MIKSFAMVPDITTIPTIKTCTLLVMLMVFSNLSFAQQKVFTFEEAKLEGKPYPLLDSLYQSAVHTDTTKAVFKSETEQNALQQAYFAMIGSLGSFLSENGFQWEDRTKCFNWIYINPNGKIDYFLYHFPDNQLSNEKEREFGRLLDLFAQDYQFGLSADVPFAQCSPIVYSSVK